MAIWDDTFKYSGKCRAGDGIEKPNKTIKGGFHLEPHLGFHFKLEHLSYFYPP